MDSNEEFVKKLACLECGRVVKNKPKWFRLQKQANGFMFYYRCEKCYSEYEALVSQETMARLHERGITIDETAATSTASTSMKTQPRPDMGTGWTYFCLPKFHRNRKERRQMKKYRRAFKKQLRAKENICLSRVAAGEGKNQKRQSD